MAELDAEARSIFLSLVDRPQDERLAALAAVCADRPDVRAKVERLLDNHVLLGTISQGEHSDQTSAASSDAEAPGAVIAGNYKLLQPLGEGGFGVVYLAEQTAPVRRKVAIKILKAGMDTRQVVARFEAERQALAIMDHPNIARVFDGGVTPTGRPFFAMEYVKGVPITEFCDEHRLTPHQRLELFVNVCQAVQHAHQKGIIHRDLKPSNVLVSRYDTTPVVKVIDFGVAKALGQELTDKTLFTAAAQMIGTPLYMSPEQAGMSDLDVDTRSDIYSLGVLLYELLTGETPFTKERFRMAAFDEIRRIIREEDPPKPSTRLSSANDSLASISAQRHMEPSKLTKLVRGELDWIVMKALDKDRNRRYETANGFAMDLQRYLADEPVQANPPSARYRFCKFARRNKSALALGAVVAGALVFAVVGLTVSNWLITREKDQKTQALSDKGKALIRETAALAKAKEQEGLANERAKDAKKQQTYAEAQELLARRRLYGSQMNLASQAWETRQPARVLELLEGQRPGPGEEDLRTFEWYYLWRLIHGGRRLALNGHSRIVTGLAYSPDGKTLASVSWDGTTRLWDAATGRETAVLQGGSCWDLAFSPDGKLLATGGKETGVVTVWKLDTKQVLQKFPVSAVGLAFSPDGRILAGGGHPARLWDVTTGHKRARLADAGAVAGFSLDGKSVVTAAGWHGGPGTIRLWDPSTGRERSHFNVPYIAAVAFSPNDETLAVSGLGKVELWHVATGRRKTSFLLDQCRPLTFSANGKSLAVGMEDRTIRVIDVATGRELAQEVHLDQVMATAFSPDGKTLASASQRGQIKTWDMKPAEDAVAVSIPDNGGKGRHNITLRFTSDSTILVVGNAGRTRLVDAATGTVIAAADPAGVTATSADGSMWAARASTDKWLVWDQKTGSERATASGLKPHAWTLGAALSPNANTLALWEEWYGGGTVTLWEVATDQSRKLRELCPERSKLSVHCVAFSPDGKSLAAALQFQCITIWDVASGRVALELSQEPSMATFGAIEFSPDSTSVAASLNNGTVKLWDARNGRLRATFKGHTRVVTGLAFSPRGETLATCGLDGTIRFWDVTTGQERLSLKAFPVGRDACLAFSPDGRTLASFGQDDTLRLWRTAIDKESRQRRPIDDDQDPDDPWALVSLGDHLATTGDPAGAEEIARRVEHLLTRRSTAATTLSDLTNLAHRWFRLGLLWELVGKPVDADRAHNRARDFERRLSLSDNAARPKRTFLAQWYVAAGNRHLSEGRDALAFRAFRRALEMRPDDREMLRHVVQSCLSHRKTLEVSTLYDEMIAQHPDDAKLKARREQIQPGVIGVWNFDESAEGWSVLHRCTATAVNGALRIETKLSDPIVQALVAGPAGWKEVSLRVRSDREAFLQVFWTTNREPDWAESRSVQAGMIVPKGREWVDVKVRFRADDTLARLRLDPDVPNPELGLQFEVDAITLKHLTEEPGRDVPAK